MTAPDPATTPMSVEEIGEAIVAEAPHVVAALITKYVNLVPVYDPKMVPANEREEALYMAGGLRAMFLAATRCQPDLADLTIRRLCDAERARRNPA